MFYCVAQERDNLEDKVFRVISIRSYVIDEIIKRMFTEERKWVRGET